MSDTAFWILAGVLLVSGLGLVVHMVWLQYKEWRLFSELLISDGGKRVEE